MRQRFSLAVLAAAALAAFLLPARADQAIESYIYGQPAASAPYGTGLRIPAAPSADDASLQYIPGNVLVTLSGTQTLTNKTIDCNSNTCTNFPGGGGGSGLSGMTAGQVPLAATATTITSSFALGTGVQTFLTTPTSANLRAALTDETGTGIAYFVGGALGTPSSGTATNLTGLPISTGVSGLGTGIATALGINTGSAGAPVLFNGAGGTPSSIALANGTGLPISTGVSGLGSGVATFLATPNETNLTAIVSGVTYLDVSQSFTKGQAVTPTADGTQSAAGTLTMDLALSNYHTATFGAGNLTVANPSNTKAGECGWLALKQDSVGSRTVSWGGNWKWAGGTAPTLTTTANASDLITFCAISTTILAGQLSVANYQ